LCLDESRWCVFRRKGAIAILGNYLQERGSDQSFHLIFLDGYDRLSTKYLSELKNVGLNLVDFSSEFWRLSTAFPGLERFGRYELLCFLRWPALGLYLKQENIREQVFHIDGDVIFNALPQDIAVDVAGLTFVLRSSGIRQCHRSRLVRPVLRRADRIRA